MFRLIKGCAVFFALLTFGPMIISALVPRGSLLLVFLGIAALVVLGIAGVIRLLTSGGLLMFLLGRATARRR